MMPSIISHTIQMSPHILLFDLYSVNITKMHKRFKGNNPHSVQNINTTKKIKLIFLHTIYFRLHLANKTMSILFERKRCVVYKRNSSTKCTFHFLSQMDFQSI